MPLKNAQAIRTQKPLIPVRAHYPGISSNPGDIILRPVLPAVPPRSIAAERLERRQWVGMDIWDGALSIVKQRMEDNRQLLTDIPYYPL